MDRPVLIESKWGNNYYNYKDFCDYLNGLNYYSGDLTGKKLYLSSKTISQSKLRDAGFEIVRSPDRADVVIVTEFMKHPSFREETYKKPSQASIYPSSGVEEFFTEFPDNSKYSFVLDKVLYKYLYKYEGNLELFNSVNELFKSQNYDNDKVAMEFITNANWTDNEIYLKELFNLHKDRMRSNSYRNSISFKGLIASLDYQWDSLYMYDAEHYRGLCKSEEHHKFVYDKFIDSFKVDLEELVTRYKVKIDELKYSIDY